MSDINITDAIKAEILTQVGLGESIVDVAKAYGINEDQIYKYIMEARNRNRQQAGIPATVATPTSTTSQTFEQPKPMASSLDAQMDHLTKEFQIKLKEILKRQILESIRGV